MMYQVHFVQRSTRKKKRLTSKLFRRSCRERTRTVRAVAGMPRVVDTFFLRTYCSLLLYGSMTPTARRAVAEMLRIGRADPLRPR